MENQNSLENLDVEIYDIIYENEKNGYTVFEFESAGLLETGTGIIPGLYVGESIKIVGQWATHPTYGKQFKVVSFEKNMPTDSVAMLKYLSSGAIKGIGPKTAERIIDTFGDDTFSILESSPELLSTIKGISKARAREISVDFNSQFGMRNVMIFFSEFFGPTLTSKIYKRWGSASIDIVKQNPYTLSNNISGIGFEKADSVATSLGLPKDSSERIEAGVLYVLRQDSITSGNLYLPLKKLVQTSSKLLGVNEDRIEESILHMCQRKLLIAYDFNSMCVTEKIENASIYLPLNYHIEKSITDKLTLLSKFQASGFFNNINQIIDDVEEREQIKYASSQKKAIISALENTVYVLTGGPGTGKTTIIRAIISIYTNLGLKYVLAAPTGRAAKKMSESTMCEAKTVHRLLEYEYSEDDDEPRFTRDESNPIEADVVIIDETSMIDANLFFSLLRAIRPGTRLLLIGDASQLPSVGAGNVLKDIIASGVFKVGTLTEIFRQEDGSSIVLNAHRINKGQYPDLSNKSSDFFFLKRESAFASSRTIVELCEKRLPTKYGQEFADKIQILCPTKKGECGTFNLNNLLQNLKNPEDENKCQIKLRDFVLREGDKVMQIKNNYDISWTKTNFWGESEEGTGVFNGDIGTVSQIDTKEEKVTIIFEEKSVIYDFQNLDEIELAYAVTIHKSQGSEYPCVIIPITSVSSMLLTRNLLYTAITRAQKMVILIGNTILIEKMVDNNADSRRYTGLTKFLRQKNELN
ncbi:MAG: ATP-dependent RecD-like DNA helicase [Ruminococcaceae bacterium]|nr:ATP-dependent RecD-like DNA helicase [Oscillospiraceae bacterium]